MKATICDFCGKPIDSIYYRVEPTEHFYCGNKQAIYKDYDICDNCWRKVVKEFKKE